MPAVGPTGIGLPASNAPGLASDSLTMLDANGSVMMDETTARRIASIRYATNRAPVPAYTRPGAPGTANRPPSEGAAAPGAGGRPGGTRSGGAAGGIPRSGGGGTRAVGLSSGGGVKGGGDPETGLSGLVASSSGPPGAPCPPEPCHVIGYALAFDCRMG